MLDALAQAIDERDPFGAGHAQRVTELAEAVAVRLRWDEQRLAALRIGARLHDVGKLLLPHKLLAKPGALDPREWAQIRAHPVVGSTLIAPVIGARSALPCVLYHHERWDGDGYPTGRRGRAIPAVARIGRLRRDDVGAAVPRRAHAAFRVAGDRALRGLAVRP